MTSLKSSWSPNKLLHRFIVGVTTISLVLPAFLLPPAAQVVRAETEYVVAAVGDIACGSTTDTQKYLCEDELVAEVISDMNPDYYLALGDIQYESGSSQDYANYYDQTFGQFNSIASPAIGNHEYGTRGAKGYFDYFNGVGNFSGPAGDRDKGYYSYNIGEKWHVVALNSQCIERENDYAVSCAEGSPQEQWLRADLAANLDRPCTIAYWHHPRFTTGTRGQYTETAPLYQALYDYGADIVLAGHNHYYQRFAPLDADGEIDEDYGIHSFVVGTGGKEMANVPTYDENNPHSTRPELLKSSPGVGALKLVLRDSGFSWDFKSATGYSLTDSGSSDCHGAPATPDPDPVVNQIVYLEPTDDSYVRSTSSGTNYGSESLVKLQGVPTQHGLFKFDLSSLAGLDIKRATLRLFITSASDDAHILKETTSDWDEDTVVYGNMPTISSNAIGEIPADTGSNNWQDIVITTAVKSHQGGLFSFATVPVNNLDDELRIVSKEDISERPHLMVQLNSPAPTPTPTPIAASVTVEPTDDTYISEASATTNYGSATSLLNDNTISIRKRSWLKFTVPALPAGAIVTSAKVTLNALNSSGATANIKQSSNTNWSESTLVWSGAPAYDSVTISNGSPTVSAPGPVNFNVSSVVASAGTYSFVITQSNQVETEWASKEASSGKPKLEVNYTYPAPTPTPTPTPTIVTLNPIADTYVDENNAGLNYGTALSVSADGSPVKVGYFKYDLEDLAGVTVSSAKLRFYVNNGSPDTQYVRDVANTSWSEAGMTYNNRPSVDTGSWGSIVANTGSNNWAEVDITNSISTKLGGLLSFALDSTGSDGLGVNSREAVANQPELVITYTQPPTPPTTTLNPIADTYVDANNPTQNFGSSTVLIADAQPVTAQYYKFNLSSLSDKRVTSAKLRLYVTNGSVDAQDVRAVDDTSWDESLVTYNSRPTVGSVIGQFVSGNQSSKYKEVDLTNSVNAKAGGLLSLAIDSTSNDGMQVNSKESANLPELVIEYDDLLTSTVQVIADAYVDSVNSTTNYGSAVSLSSDTDDSKVTFLKFDLSPYATNYLVSAKLRLYVNNGSVNQQNIKLTSASNWVESTLNYSNQPTLSSLVGTLSSNNQANKWHEVTITGIGALLGSELSLAIENQGNDGLYINSRETSEKAELVLEYR